MRRLLVLGGMVMVCAAARADYLQLSRVASVKTEPARNAKTLVELKPGDEVALIDDAQQNGYYHVRANGDQTGWIYRTFGRRNRGDPQVSSAPSVTASGRVQPSATTTAHDSPTEDAYAAPVGHSWGNASKSTGCQASAGLPDPLCTPGEVLPKEDESAVCSSDFRTKSIRDHTTTTAQKNAVYPMYSIPHPAHNTGSSQVCEIDHLVPLELGGADTIVNLWPQCSEGYENWQGPGFREKDGFENYLWYHVCVNQDVLLKDAQTQIATNWRKYWEIAGKPECRNRSNCE